mmetsp:Transcript_5651/g.12293  ORF Transcript_5651/g.12293 Transcript_5651/m.12293 type:complete len:213 (-) Transcript_5651:4-642(-)|eukprot:4086744-Pleurochrysis_carterae.AAC.8
MAARTPAGLQLNLYKRGVVKATSGAGMPPHTERKEMTLPPSAWTRSMMAFADMWSSPGSSPISHRMGTRWLRASASRARSSSDTYEAVTSGVRCCTHADATDACIGGGSSDRQPSASSISATTRVQSLGSALGQPVGEAERVAARRLGRPTAAQTAAASPGTLDTTVTERDSSRESSSTAGCAHSPAPSTSSGGSFACGTLEAADAKPREEI